MEKKKLKPNSIEALGKETFFDRKYGWVVYNGLTGWAAFRASLHLPPTVQAELFEVTYQQIWNWRNLP